ncbi:DMT family transporter [Pseudoclavibacter endophyticus]|uniref:DMT family transporter n=1 Tax=Pseudoclavibacter endophyticus TaxID=1778590 RepID=A0A6H9WHP4_9MICO|nr:DMT family transporter [Pseudoclavibacter endophyticus]KAB1648813.1 DMT family transporter [Pseudoclavibacter endophyticus]
MTTSNTPEAAAPPPRSRRVAVVVWTAAVVFGGSLMGVQARMNGELATVSGDWSWAALVSFGGGLMLLAFAAMTSKRRALALPRIVAAVRQGRLAWWHTIAGLSGALFVVVQATVAPVLGVAILTIAFVAGQTIGGLAADRFGFGAGGVERISVPRLAGGALVVVAVLVSVAGRLEGGFAWWLLILPVISGFFVAFQQAFNGRVRVQTDVFAATLGNFFIGTMALALVFAVHGALVAGPFDWFGAPWYVYLGGVAGVIGVPIAAVAVGTIGVLRLALALVTGQLVGSLVLDLTLPLATTAVTAWTYVGLALAFVAIVITSVRWGRR